MKRLFFFAASAFVFFSCSPGAGTAAPAQDVKGTTAPAAETATAKAVAGANPLDGIGLSVFPEPQDIPDISFVALDGSAKNLSSFRGKVVLLNFWATWCPPCKAEMPSIQRLSDKLAGKDFTVLAISVNESRATVEAFLAKNPYKFPIFLDETGQQSSGFVGRGIPTTYLVDKQGRALAGIIGSKEWDDPAVVAAFTALAAK
ncbi:MAG: hypothetical protein A2Z99_09900 [Treponema sp. GWB1_62_6]|nr:MAG: hypothetical protein A2Y36_17850 [Treponema sp. GWA1_62_8]OHE63731.1 MAG: hypothetical protein A2001_00745 [Treponema sp. GWC1_61_84]OHE69278.1 MAG: hypothetical protein A2413_09005 [Treponema sp. RIFOXYC1_FULL_61_9]OHE72141.1 MAG: hypothetical protein A2Z99_09900 [Treponema sp. GWB1_62_6]